MKWYITYITIWIIVFMVYLAFFTSNSDPMDIRIFVSLGIGTIISTAIYAGFQSGTKTKKK